MGRKKGPTILLYEQNGWRKPGDEVIEEADGSIRIMGPEVGMATYGLIDSMKLVSFYFGRMLEDKLKRGMTQQEILKEWEMPSKRVQQAEHREKSRDKVGDVCDDMARAFLADSGIQDTPVNRYLAKQLFITIETCDKDSLGALKELLRWGRTDDGEGDAPEVPIDALAKIFQNLKDSGLPEEEVRKAMKEQYGGEDDDKPQDI